MRTRLTLLTAVGLLISNLSACQVEVEPESVVLDQARAKIDQGNFVEALDLMRGLVERNPEDSRIQRIYGEALLATGQPSLAVWPLSRAMKDPDQAVSAGLLLVRAQLQGGTGQDAIGTATRVIELDPDSPGAYLLRARAYLEESLEEESLADLDRAVEHGLSGNEIELLRLYALLGLDRIEESEALLTQLYEKAVSQTDSNPQHASEMCGATAQFAYESENLELAEERFEGCLAGEGLRSPNLVERAMRFFDETGRYARGTEIARRRFEANDRNLLARVSYAQRLVGNREFAAAEALLLEATNTQPAAWSALVDYYTDREEFRKALDALEEALAANPYAPDTWQLSRADLLIILGELDRAERSLENVELEVHRAVIEGRLLLARGQLEPAAKRFEQAIVLWPTNPDLRYLTANAYERMGDWTSAANHLREAARMEPPHYLSSRALADIMRGIGDREGRAFVLMRLSEANPGDAEVLEELLDVARESGSEALAKKSLSRLMRIPGQQGRAIANVARVTAQSKGVSAAIESIDAAGVDLSLPPFFDALEARCEYLAQIERRDEAIAQLDAILSGPEQRAHASPLHALRGQLHLGAGSLEAAQSDFEQARAIDPRSLEAATGLAAVAEARGELDQARSLFEEAIAIEQSLLRPSADIAIEYARFDVRNERAKAAADRLRQLRDSQPRNGEAALLLAQILRNQSGDASPSKELLDAARAALLFEQGPGARELTTLFPKSPNSAADAARTATTPPNRKLASPQAAKPTMAN